MCVLDVGLFELALRSSDGRDPVSTVVLFQKQEPCNTFIKCTNFHSGLSLFNDNYFAVDQPSVFDLICYY